MLGHLYPQTCSLDQFSKTNYKNLYCSICASIRQKNHVGYTLVLNNELTLILLALRSYYTPTENKTPCPSSLYLKKNSISEHKVVQKAGDLSILLGWIKSEDWQADKGSIISKIVSKKFYYKADPLLKNTSSVFQNTIQEYVNLTKQDNRNFEFVKQQSALLAKALLLELALDCQISKEHLQTILSLFKEAGILINIVDHLLDLDKDLEQKEYNPILENTHSTDDIAKNYYHLKADFFQHIQEAQNIIQLMRKHKISNHAFYTAFSQSLVRMEKEVKNNPPQLIQLFEKNTPIEKIKIIKNDCDCDVGDNCDCSDCCCDCSDYCCECDGNNNNKKKKRKKKHVQNSEMKIVQNSCSPTEINEFVNSCCCDEAGNACCSQHGNKQASMGCGGAGGGGNLCDCICGIIDCTVKESCNCIESCCNCCSDKAIETKEGIIQTIDSTQTSIEFEKDSLKELLNDDIDLDQLQENLNNTPNKENNK